MDTLFPLDPAYPDGFTYLPDFISYEEEAYWLEKIKEFTFREFEFQGYKAKRKVVSFGYDWNFTTRRLSEGSPVPDIFSSLLDKVGETLSIPAKEIAELLLTEYPVGSVINWHRDAPPFETIIEISLASDCIFRFRPYDKEKRTKRSILSLPVKRRSLYVMKGISRSDWEHSIQPVKSVRYSITLRTLRF